MNMLAQNAKKRLPKRESASLPTRVREYGEEQWPGIARSGQAPRPSLSLWFFQNGEAFTLPSPLTRS